MTPPRTRLLAWTVAAAALLPALTAVAGALLIRAWRDELPASVAVHWGMDGTPDDFAGPSAVALFVGGFGVVAAAVGGVLAVLVHRDGLLARSVAAVTAGTTAFVTVLTTLLVAAQRDLPDATEAGIGAVPIVSSLAAAVVLAALAGWLVRPGSRPSRLSQPGVPAGAPLLHVEPGERVVWTRSVASGSVASVVLVAGVGVMVVTGLLARQWWVLGLAAALIALVAAMYSVTVTVDRHGLTVRGRFGWPRLRTPIEQIQHASVVEVRPIRHFGGYGYRIAAFGPLRGASGFILRGGQGLVVDCADGRRSVVVVDDAETAAGLLNAMVEAARA